MKAWSDTARTTAARLRQEFDLTFAQPLVAAQQAGTTLISIRVRADPFALPLQAIAGLFVDRAVTPIPTPYRDLLGVTGFRGAVIPVYDLGVILGYPAAARPRWLTLSSGRSPIGLAFDAFEGTERIAAAPDEDSAAAGSGGGGPHLRHVARTTGGPPRPIVDIPSILDAIDRRSANADKVKADR